MDSTAKAEEQTETVGKIKKADSTEAIKQLTDAIIKLTEEVRTNAKATRTEYDQITQWVKAGKF